MILCIFVVLFVISPLYYFVYMDPLFFSLWTWLEVVNFIYLLNKPTCRFIDLFYCFLDLYFIYFLPHLFYFFPSAAVGFWLFFSNSFRLQVSLRFFSWGRLYFFLEEGYINFLLELFLLHPIRCKVEISLFFVSRYFLISSLISLLIHCFLLVACWSIFIIFSSLFFL